MVQFPQSCSKLIIHKFIMDMHYSLFQFNRLTFDVKMASFQPNRISGAVAYLNDIDTTITETIDWELQSTNILRLCSVWLHADKNQFFVLSIFGSIFNKFSHDQLLGSMGIIQWMPVLVDTNILGLFIHSFKVFLLVLCFCQQLRKNEFWKWSAECCAAFLKLKSIHSSQLLTYFDLKHKIVADTFSYRGGALIFHILPEGIKKAIIMHLILEKSIINK